MASGTIKAVVGRSDIVNNLTTNDSTKVLSAAQGKALKDAADTLNGKFTLGIPIDHINFFGNATNLLNLRFYMNLAETSYYQLQYNGGNKKLIFTRHDTDGTDTDLVTFTGT